ncbi:CLUMA_CG021643, isoform A [Clunio marinus]|uniref:CLUMA_CG021643, isoform A n=1 Tax=Clunio marinus TaxID=568069 RepID=A0A1J1J837_9DIPT|nr:CLUMA_CG021643, isoform A [Clunio marinus]
MNKKLRYSIAVANAAGKSGTSCFHSNHVLVFLLTKLSFFFVLHIERYRRKTAHHLRNLEECSSNIT